MPYTLTSNLQLKGCLILTVILSDFLLNLFIQKYTQQYLKVNVTFLHSIVIADEVIRLFLANFVL